MTDLDSISAWAQTVNWNAWGAIGTVAAVGWAIWIAAESSREARRRDAAKIEAIIVLADGIRAIFSGRVERGPTPDVTDAHLFDAFRNLRVFSEAVVVTDLPTATTVDAYMRVATAIQMVHALQTAVTAQTYPMDRYLAFCTEAAESCASQVRRLSDHRDEVSKPLRSWLKRSFHS